MQYLSVICEMRLRGRQRKRIGHDGNVRSRTGKVVMSKGCKSTQVANNDQRGFLLFAMVWQALKETRTYRAVWKNVSKRRKRTQKEEGKQSQRIGIDWDGNGRVDKGTARRCGHLGGGYRVGMTSVAPETKRRTDADGPVGCSDPVPCSLRR